MSFLLTKTNARISKARSARARYCRSSTEAVAEDGTSSGRVFSKERMNVICPWHGYEFDIRTGVHPTDRRVRLRRVPVRVSDGALFITVKD